MSKKILIAKFGRPFGILGWIKINSFTIPASNIINFNLFYIQQNNEWIKFEFELIKARENDIIAKLKNCDTPEAVKHFTNLDLYVDRNELPKLDKKEYYWADLEGLQVINTKNINFGKVDHLMATGANDVLVVKDDKKERLIPFTKQVIINIDLENKSLVVDWDEDF